MRAYVTLEAGKLYRTRSMQQACVEFRTEAKSTFPWKGWVLVYDGTKRAVSWRDDNLDYARQCFKESKDIVLHWNDGWVTLRDWVDFEHDADAFKKAWTACCGDTEVAQLYSVSSCQWTGFRYNGTAAVSEFDLPTTHYRLRIGLRGELPESPVSAAADCMAVDTAQWNWKTAGSAFFERASPELRRRFERTCNALAVQKHCGGTVNIACVDCPGWKMYNDDLDCKASGWNPGPTCGITEPNDALAQNAIQWLSDHGCEDQWLPDGCVAFRVDGTSGRLYAGDRYVDEWLRAGNLFGFAFRRPDGSTAILNTPGVCYVDDKHLWRAWSAGCEPIRPFAVLVREDKK